jgi:hypothetical protein
MSELSHFFQLKNTLREEKNKEQSARTLDWYNRVGEMLDSDTYSSNRSFLQSVAEFIEKNEYITDNQIEVCEKIYHHPNWD